MRFPLTRIRTSFARTGDRLRSFVDPRHAPASEDDNWDVVRSGSAYALTLEILGTTDGGENEPVDPYLAELQCRNARRDGWMNATISRLCDEADQWKLYAESVVQLAAAAEAELAVREDELDATEAAMHAQRATLLALQAQVAAAFGADSDADFVLAHSEPSPRPRFMVDEALRFRESAAA